MYKDTKNKLSVLSVLFHWVIAAMFITLIVIGLLIEDMPRGPEKSELIDLHKSLGAIFLLLAVARLIHRLTQGFPKELSEKTVIQKKISASVHHLLLLATILMPVTGLMMSLGGGHGLEVFGLTVFGHGEDITWISSIGHNLHGIVGNIVIGIVALHAVAAIRQQFIDKALTRMIGREV